MQTNIRMKYLFLDKSGRLFYITPQIKLILVFGQNIIDSKFMIFARSFYDRIFFGILTFLSLTFMFQIQKFYDPLEKVCVFSIIIAI